MLSASVRDQVSDECLRELVLFGPDGEGPAEISAGDAAGRENDLKKLLKLWNE